MAENIEEKKDIPLTREEGHKLTELVEKSRKLAEKYGEDSIEFKNYMERTEKELEELDKKNEQWVQQIEDEKKKNIELEERIKHLETLGTNSQGNTLDEKDKRKNADKLVNAFCKGNWIDLVEKNEKLVKSFYDEIAYSVDLGVSEDSQVKKFEDLIKKYRVKSTNDILRSDINEFGGFLCPTAWSEEFLRLVEEISPVRRFARVKTIGTKDLQQPIRKKIPVATWEGETTEGGSSVPEYINETFIPYRLTNTTPVTYDELQTNAYNVSNEIMEDNRLAFAKAEGYAFVRGNDVRQPLGFVNPSANIPEYETATSTLTFDDLILASGQIKSGYDPIYCFNRVTMAYLRQIRDDSTGAYLWLGPFGGGSGAAPATINGYRYSSEFIDMDSYTVAEGIPVVFADFARFYQIVDRASTIIIKDEFTRKKEAIIEFTLMRWTYGRPVIKEAGILIKLKAA